MTSRTDKQIRDEALVFYENDIEDLGAIMDVFLKKSGATCALLVDQAGHMITNRGQTDKVDLDTISALVAGSFAATKQLARQFGEEEFTALFHQGKNRNMQLSLVGGRALLTALFSDDTTIGMVRLYATEAANRLTEVFVKKLERQRAGDSAPEAGGLLGQGGFISDSADALDDIFGDE